MNTTAEKLLALRDVSISILSSLRMLWIDRDGGIRDLTGRHAGDHLDMLGQVCRSFYPQLDLFGECFGLLARVSRQPYGTIHFTASSTTEYVVKQSCTLVQSLDNTVTGMSLQKPNGLTDDEKEVYRQAWKALREPFDNSGFLPTYGKCDALAAEVEWEYHRAMGLLPPSAKPHRPVEACAIELFFSYSHKDEGLRDMLAAHLSQLKNEGRIRDWHDRKIGAGTEWAGQIDQHLNAAHFILLLISADFLGSRYCHDVEMRRAMERHEAGEARVIPVILRPCDWHTAVFGRLQALPKDGKPVTKWQNRDEAFTDVARGIRAAVSDLSAATGSGAT
jgi:hypothetical protein